MIKEFFHFFIKRTTVISILSLAIILIGLPFGLYALTLKGGQSLGGVITLMIVLAVFILLVFERAIIQGIQDFNLKRINIIESIIIISLLIIYNLK